MTASACRRGLNCNGRKLLFPRCSLFNHDDLSATIKSAVWADMMWAPHFAAIPASNEVDRGDEDVATTVALAVPTDSLLGKRTHDKSPVLFVIARLKQ